jgi:hypothetical protein
MDSHISFVEAWSVFSSVEHGQNTASGLVGPLYKLLDRFNDGFVSKSKRCDLLLNFAERIKCRA